MITAPPTHAQLASLVNQFAGDISATVLHSPRMKTVEWVSLICSHILFVFEGVSVTGIVITAYNNMQLSLYIHTFLKQI